MSARHAVFVAFGIVVGFLMVLITLIVMLAANTSQDNDPTPIVTIRSCTKACEMLV